MKSFTSLAANLFLWKEEKEPCGEVKCNFFLNQFSLRVDS